MSKPQNTDRLKYIYLSESDAYYEIVFQFDCGGVSFSVGKGDNARAVVANLQHLVSLIERLAAVNKKFSITRTGNSVRDG